MEKTIRILSLEIRYEHDVVQARQRARRIAALLEFESQDQTRISTAVSELARNAFQYASGGTIEFSISEFHKNRSRSALTVRVSDDGPGIPHLNQILEGKYVSKTGMGVGLVGASRLMDGFSVESRDLRGTTVTLQKVISEKMPQPTAKFIGSMVLELSKSEPENPIQEVQQQNQELLRALAELRSSQLQLEEVNAALAATNSELEETNRGVVALYTEIDEKNEDLRKASQLKSSFISYMSHEFRTPLNSILGLSQILLDRVDGDLTSEQETQAKYIHQAARDILEMVNDLLDLAKVEAGKTLVYPKPFELADVFSTLRGMMRPLVSSPDVELVIEEPQWTDEVRTDEGKLHQILRNLISNALKFTESGQVRVTSELGADGFLVIRVADTGIGIAPENLSRIFDEYSQIDSPLQRRLKGTGLGLPLVKRLAELLRGSVSVQSEPGFGTTFTVRIPVIYADPSTSESAQGGPPGLTRTGSFERNPSDSEIAGTVLIVDDNEASRYLLREYLKNTGLMFFEARDGFEGLRLARNLRPQVIFLDVVMPGMGAFEFLREMKADPELREIPVVIRTSQILSPEDRKTLAEQSVALLSKEASSKEQATEDARAALQVALGAEDRLGRGSKNA